MNKKVRLADFMNALDENFQIIMGIIFVDEDGTYYCTKDYIHSKLSKTVLADKLSKEPIIDQCRYLMNQEFEIQEITTVWASGQYLKVHVKNKDRRKGWLRDLKVGDKVGMLKTTGVLGRTMTVEVVKDITTTGEIVLSDTTIPANGTLHYEGYKTIRLVRVDETE